MQLATMRYAEREVTLLRPEGVFVLRSDVTQEESIGAGVSAGMACFGKIDVRFINTVDGAHWLETTKAILPHIRANRVDIVINISSTAGLVALPLSSQYLRYELCLRGTDGGIEL